MRAIISIGAGVFALAALFPVACLAVIVAAALVTPAHAAEISIPYGDWIASLAGQHTHEIFVAVLLFLLRKLPASAYAAIQMMRVDQLLERAIQYGLNSVAGAARGRVLTVNVGSQVLAEAMTYAVDSAPVLIHWLGGQEALKKKLFARLELVPEASFEKLEQALDH